MSPTVEDVLVARGRVDGGYSRMITGSFVVHVAAVALAIFIPRAWFDRPKESPLMISISLGGTPGPQTTGMTPIAGKNVEPTPPPPKPEPPRPAPPAPKQPDLTSLMNKIVTQPPKTTDSTRTAPTTRPPSAQTPSRGDARTETSSRTEAPGLSTGGGAGSDRMAFDPNFCCMAYAQTVVGLIDQSWRKNQSERGTTVMRFELRRDGSIANVSVEQSSGNSLLDRVAQSAVEDVARRKAPPLPPEYKENVLVFHLKFPYGG